MRRCGGSRSRFVLEIKAQIEHERKVLHSHFLTLVLIIMCLSTKVVNYFKNGKQGLV